MKVRKELDTIMLRSSHPGDTIRDILEEQGISDYEFAKMIDKPLAFVVRLLEGKEGVDDELAEILSNKCGWSSKQFWLNRERNYKTALKGTKVG